MTLVNVKTIEFSMTEQSVVNGETPATSFGMPSCVRRAAEHGLDVRDVARVGLDDRTSNGANSSRMHETVAFQVVALTFHAGIVVCCVAIVERLVRESLLPGSSVTPFLLR